MENPSLFNMNSKRIIVLAPHTDDGELGCGATIAKFIAGGAIVYYATFSLAEESVPPPLPRNTLETEVKAATARLGVSPECLLLFHFLVRQFSYHRQDILEELVKLNKDIKPHLVLMPCLNDLHQDHMTIATEGLRAFKKTSMLGYELPWNNLTFSTQCFITISPEHLRAKIEALNCYNSQKHREYLSEEYIRSLAITRGTQIGQKYAEVFEVVRWIF
jgi:LmbE family N-acetylglucosaminyl deacetylase